MNDWVRICRNNGSLDFQQYAQLHNYISTVIAVPHIIIFVWTLLHLPLLWCWRRTNKLQTSPYHARFPGHVVRWIFALFATILGLWLTAEGYITGDSFWADDVSARVQLCLTSLATTLGVISAIVCYNFAESWRYRHMIYPLLFYWITALATTILSLCVFRRCQAMFTLKLILILLTMCYFILLLMDTYGVLNTGSNSKGILKVVHGSFSKTRMFYRESYSNLLSQLTFWWLNFLFFLGARRTITQSRLGAIPEKHDANYIYTRFKKIYDAEEIKRTGNQKNTSRLLYVIGLAHWSRMLAAGSLKLIADMLSYIGPLALSGITAYVNTRNVDGQDRESLDTHKEAPVKGSTFSALTSNGYVLVSLVFVASVIQHLCNQLYQYRVAVEGLHVKSAIQTMVYNKSLRLSTHAMSSGLMSMGQVTNHLSVDANNVMYFFLNANEIWAIPLKITVAMALLYRQLGFAAICASSLFVIVVPVQMIVASTMARIRKSVIKKSDTRLRISHEMLQGIKNLKLYGWESIHYETVKAARNLELQELVKIYVLFAIMFSINYGTPIAMTLMAFSLNAPLNDTRLTPDRAFSSLALFNQITTPCELLPYVINLSVNLYNSTKRLDIFLSGPEVQTIEEVSTTQLDEVYPMSARNNRQRYRNRHGEANVMSSYPILLETVLESNDEDGDDDVFLTPTQTRRRVESKCNVNQNHPVPCLGTERLTTSQFSRFEHRSRDSEASVAIRIRNGGFVWNPTSDEPDIRDINVDIPLGKLTIICGSVGSGKTSLLGAILGEMTVINGSIQIHKGHSRTAYAPQKAWLVNTSLRNNILFGEKMISSRYQRIIRACSLQADIKMLPAKDRTEIGEKGINLSGGQKQRVSVARTMYAESDIVLLDDPLSALDLHVGTELFKRGILGLLRERHQTVILVTHHLQYLPHADKIILMEDGRIKFQGSPSNISRSCPDLEVRWKQAVRRASERESGAPEHSVTAKERKLLFRQCSRHISIFSQSESVVADERGRVIAQEDRQEGAVSLSNYLYYISAMGYVLSAVIFGSILLQASLQVATKFWLSSWSQSELNATDVSDDKPVTPESNTVGNDSTSYFVAGFAGLSIGTVVSQIILIFIVNTGIFVAAKSLHLTMLENIIRAPMRFFDVTPVGRILNRLSNDTNLIDDRLLITINMLINSLINVIALIVVNTAVNWYFLTFFAPIAILFFVLLILYIRTSREIQRIESISRSPIFAHFSETLLGLTTIRAYNAEGRFFREMSDRININNTASLYLLAGQRWLGVRLDMLGSLVVLTAGMTCLSLSITSSHVGLVISYSLTVSACLNLLVRSCSDLELHMNAVERVHFYSMVPSEHYAGKEPPADWPSRGEVVMENIGVRYAPELPPVLKNVNARIKPGQKIGICGRTGCGKSSLTLALFRTVDTFQGRILMDGIDITSVPLTTLRHRLSIIPQDATLFTGTIRSNLDPARLQDDSEIWSALEVSQLKETILQLNDGLDSEVSEGGENFSVGQRQLLCIARAILRKSSVLVMDEATASIDKQTDKTLQAVMKEVFKDRTVITIAHRVETIRDSDLILTLGEGTVSEFDTPQNLIERPGIYASLLRLGH